MPKKPPKNSFFFYMLDFKQQEERKGRKFLGGMREVADAASPSWKTLTKEEKAPYEEQAKLDKQKQKNNGERYTTYGVPISLVQREEQEIEVKKHTQKEIIDNMLEKCVKDGTLADMNFFIVSFNYFIKHFDGNYFPSEVGAVAFSIQKGVQFKFHDLIDPGKLPMGTAFDAKDHSEKTHKLLPPPNALGNSNYASILTVFTEFLAMNLNGDVGGKFPLLVKEEEQEIVLNILTQFCDAAQINSDQYVLLPLTYFFQKLRESCQFYYKNNADVPFTYAMASSYFDRDIYQFYEKNGCDYHEQGDINIHCALSRPVRWAYTILDQTIGICDVKEKKGGFHFPPDCKTFDIEVKKKEESENDCSDDDEKKYDSRLSGAGAKRETFKQEDNYKSKNSNQYRPNNNGNRGSYEKQDKRQRYGSTSSKY